MYVCVYKSVKFRNVIIVLTESGITVMKNHVYISDSVLKERVKSLNKS